MRRNFTVHPGCSKGNNLTKLECIPVGCVPSAAVAVGGGGVYPGGVSAQRDVCHTPLL